MAVINCSAQADQLPIQVYLYGCALHYRYKSIAVQAGGYVQF